jgi:Transposase DDE domain
LRNRKFTPKNIFLSVLHLATSTNNDGYLCALHKTWQKSGLGLTDTPAKGSLSKYRKNVLAEFFEDIFEADLERLNPQRKKFHGLYVYAIDGDHLDLPASDDVLKNGYRGYYYATGRETHYPKMYTVQAVDLINGVIKQFAYSKTVGETLLARRMVGQLEKNSITLYDRLYGNYPTALAHEEAENYFLARVRTEGAIHRQVKEFCQSSMRSCVVKLKPSRSKSQPEIEVRLIKVRNPRTKEVAVFMTNLSKELFTDKQVGKLYRRRWEIEGSFRDLTSTLKMCQWHSTSLNGILQEIYALLWLVNQVRLLVTRTVSSAGDWLDDEYKKSNFKLCTQLVMDHLDLLLRCDLRKFREILDYWIKRSIEKRRHLSRSYPRQVKRFGKKYKNASTVKRRSPPLRGVA